MQVTRRAFLELSAKSMAAGICFPALARASVFRAAAGPPGARVLVVVELNGGNDALNTVVPFEDDAYHRARPVLRVRKEKVLKITDLLGFHPELAPLHRLFAQGRLAVVPGVGYPHPDRSHFTAMDIWHTADPAGGRRRAGWLGRWFDAQERSADVGPAGMAIGGALPLAMRAETCQVPAIQGLGGLTLRTDPRSGNDAALEVRTIKELSALTRAEEPETVAFLRAALRDACADGDRLRRVAQAYRPKAAYQGDLGTKLRLIAQMVDGGFPVRVFYVSVGGFDTHAGQDFAHANLLRAVAAAIEAFFVDLGAHGHAERVALLAFSEFGRRVQENGSRGTDHGAAGVVLVAGGGVRGGVVGEHPNLVDLDAGDLKFTTDFRSVYATVLEKWLHAPSAAVLGGRFATLPLFRETAV
jgi:uncharacterized protein (DUF1501 family)